MNRREFLKSAAALLALGLLPGCRRALADSAATGSAGLTRRTLPSIGLPISLLGYGLMRMPKKGAGPEIDYEKGLALIDRAMKAGINYYDTAWFYHDGLSEKFAGDALSRYPRESYYLASKLPMRILESVKQAEETFAKQLEKCRTEYFDFYLLHNLNGPLWKKCLENGTVEYGLSLKGKGKVRRIGFSFHGDTGDFKEILKARQWDFVQIQANYFDWEDYSREQYEAAAAAGIPVVVMEPLRGGELARLRPQAREVFEKSRPGSTPAQWALRFVASLPNVMTVLSGMTQPEHLEENIATFSPLEPMKREEEAVLAAALKAYKEEGRVPCTGCRYCLPCPAGVKIPDIFKAYNDYRRNGQKREAKRAYVELGKEAQATACVGCGACLKKCPQKIDIPKELKRIHEELR